MRSAVPACLLAIAIAGCAASPAPAPQAAAVAAPCGGKPTFSAGSERATLWLRHSAEFRAASEIIYRAAETALRAGLADSAWSAEPTQTGDFSALPPAVVMDIDETVLDNSPQQAQMSLDDTCFEDFAKAWDAWLAARSAAAIPGAAAFIRAARGMKDAQGRPVRIFFITNRECVARPGSAAACPQQDDTAANLRTLGLDAPTLESDLMLKGERPDWIGEKQSRRLALAATHRILLYVGDDFGDFLPDVKRQTVREREQARCGHRDRWGRQWFMIPNPMYGSWLVALGPDLEAALAASPPVIENCDAP
jgi:5'-nucleotidase (lipoprotein e(P4) family)